MKRDTKYYDGEIIFIGAHPAQTSEQVRAPYEQACRELIDGKWHHLNVVRSDVGLHVYQDGDIVPDVSGNNNHGRMHRG